MIRKTTIKLVAFFITFTAIFGICMPKITADAAVLNEIFEEREIIRGVNYRYIRRLESFGFVDAYVVTADLNEPHVKLEVLKSKNGGSFLENTYKMAQESDALAAINADFFAQKRGQSGRGSAVGVEIIDGELKSSASVTESMNTLYKGFEENRFYINAFEFDMTVRAQNGQTDKIKVVNKYDDLKGIVMYTDDWGETSVGSIGGSIEVSVDKDGKVLEKVTEAEGLKIPEGGYTLVSHMSYNTFLLDNVNVGDTISVDIKSVPNLNFIETAVGGGGIILNKGNVLTSFSHTISGRHPRSAVGIDETGTVITLVAIDGRGDKSKGMTMTELGAFMRELGCYTALNLDGGGSTLLAIDNNGEKEVKNTPSDGGYRKVTNSIGITSTAEKNLPVISLEFNNDKNVFINTSVDLRLSGKDKYNREKEVDSLKATFKTNGGKVSNGIFYPDKTGVFLVEAEFNGILAETTFNVLENAREINFSKTKVNIKSGESFYPVLVAKDMDGNKAEIKLADALVTLSNDNVELSGEKIIGLKKGSTVITAKFGEVTANMVVMIDGAEEISAPGNVTLPDIKNVSRELYEDGAYRFSVFGNTRDEGVLFDRFIMNKALYRMKLSSDFGIFLGANVNTSIIERAYENYVLAKDYSCFNKGISTFITLPNVSGTVYSSGSASLWTKFFDDVKASQENLFIFLDRNFISNDELELKVFKEALQDEVNKGKNVYVFGGGFVNQNTVDDGVRYINTAGVFPSISIEGTSVSYVKYVLVTVNGKDVTFEYKPIIGD